MAGAGMIAASQLSDGLSLTRRVQTLISQYAAGLFDEIGLLERIIARPPITGGDAELCRRIMKMGRINPLGRDESDPMQRLRAMADDALAGRDEAYVDIEVEKARQVLVGMRRIGERND